jgi:crotonobetainyl-CoA:carnitine CoA-transferase CaiB-like acyl-CoA transferase
MLLDYAESGRIVDRAGLDSERGCPHGVFAADGLERYVAIEARGPEQWGALCSMVPELADLAKGSQLDRLRDRLARKAEIEAAVASWCAERDAFAQAEELRAAGVPAYAVLRATDFHNDPQLSARDFFIELEHAAIGTSTFDGAVTSFSRTPARPTRAGPTIGQHTFEVMRDILGYSEAEISDIAATGTLS